MKITEFDQLSLKTVSTPAKPALELLWYVVFHKRDAN